MTDKTFIAISIGISNDIPVLIHTTAGVSLHKESGISFDEAIAFLFSLIHQRRDDTTTVFVCYDQRKEYEFLFSSMSTDLKDRLFRSDIIDKEATALESEIETIDDILYAANPLEWLHKDLQEQAFSRLTNKLALEQLLEVEHNGFTIKLIQGKFLSIKRGKKIITIYDIAGFFGNPVKSLDAVASRWLEIGISCKELSAIQQCAINSFAVRDLATKLNTSLQEHGINLSRYHGASALASNLLGRVKAKSEFHSYRYRRQLSEELWKAVRQANYGGRAEQFKIGTYKDVYIYDINSAYAHSITFLPKLLRKPHFIKEWSPCPFSIWYCDYDFRNCNPYFGIFPNRDATNATQYKLKGKSYLWQPEVQFALRHYPDCIQVQGGFVIDYEQSEFGRGIELLYDLRRELQRRNDPLEKVLKLALASMYGKFCQHNGRSHYYNLFYAGFITSFTRMQLLEATKDYEEKTICFQTDAIHSLSPSLNLCVDDQLGGLRRENFRSITYLDNGVYRANPVNGINGQDQIGLKEKTRGFKAFDFDKAIREITNEKTYSALVEFFVGHNLFRQQMFSGAKYLHNLAMEKKTNPFELDRTAMRLFEVLNVDLTATGIESKPLMTFSGRESMPYRQNNFRQIAGAMI